MSISANSNEGQDFRRNNVSKGVDLLLTIFQKAGQRLFPRTIMTKKLGRQIKVHDKEQIMYWFEQSSYEDCRVNAYPAFLSEAEEYDYENGINRNLLTPSILFIDLDSANFASNEELDKWLKRILDYTASILYGFRPLVLWSGNGYHIIIPVNAPESLEQYEDLLPYSKQPSNEFLRFTKKFLSLGKADEQNNPSFKSCLLRVPFTNNSKSQQKVRIVESLHMAQALPNIDTLLMEFIMHLQDQTPGPGTNGSIDLKKGIDVHKDSLQDTLY